VAIKEAALLSAATQQGLINVQQMQEARQIARRDRISVMAVMGRSFRLPQTSFFHAYAHQRQLPFHTLDTLTPHQEVLERLPNNVMLKRLMMPVVQEDGHWHLVMADPDDTVALDTVRRVVNHDFTIAMAEPVTLESVLRHALDEPWQEEETDPVMLLDDLMKEAYVRRASDVHLEPNRHGMIVRYRVDGQLAPYPRLLSPEQTRQVINRIKVLSGLDISEQRQPQDGGFSNTLNNWDLPATDLRVATIPTRWGERITMRILGNETQSLKLTQLGMPPHVLECLEQALVNPDGMILVTGPTGSGKSTTLYGVLRELDRHHLNVLTVEDPIEQLLDGISQVQVSVKVGFAGALRSFLRHDPDIILVGEIRDQDTAETAMKAAMTGHLVLSTLHTNDATSAVGRLRNMGTESFMVGSTLRLVLAQRLVRRLCPHCRQPFEVESPERQRLGLSNEALLYQAQGCPSCVGTGYSGRVGLYEVFQVNGEIARAISEGVDDQTLRRQAGDQLYSLWQDARSKALEGLTSLDEVLPFFEPDEVNQTPDEVTS